MKASDTIGQLKRRIEFHKHNAQEANCYNLVRYFDDLHKKLELFLELDKEFIRLGLDSKPEC